MESVNLSTLLRRGNSHVQCLQCVGLCARCCDKHYVVLGPGILGMFIINEQIFLFPLSSPPLNSYSSEVLICMTLYSRVLKHAILQ